MISYRSLRRVQNATTAGSPGIITLPGNGVQFSGGIDGNALKLSAVYACVTILGDSMSKLPIYIMDSVTKERPDRGKFPIMDLLMVRPNEAMTPSVRMDVLEASRNLGGNSYDWIRRDPRTAEPVELIPLSDDLCTPYLDRSGHYFYIVTNPLTGEMFRLPPEDICHYKAYSRHGLKGISVLRYARETIETGLAAQTYERSAYVNGGSPAGVLTTDQDIGGKKEILDKDGNVVETITKREAVRRDWEKVHAGPDKAFRVAVLDVGLKYQSIGINNRDAQFVENKDITVQDIARFFKIPLYKLQSGKQSYNSNEQNAIEYVVGTLHPIVTQYEQEMTYKLLFASDRAKNYEIRINMMAELRGDTSSRIQWYQKGREMGYFSVNDIAELEDTPAVPGGDIRLVSRNFAPLDEFREFCKSGTKKGGK